MPFFNAHQHAFHNIAFTALRVVIEKSYVSYVFIPRRPPRPRSPHIQRTLADIMGKSKRGQREALKSTEGPSELHDALAELVPPPAMIRALRALTADMSAAVSPGEVPTE